MLVEFVGQSKRDTEHEAADPSRLINCYREPVGGMAGHIIRSVLGQEEKDNIGAFPIRAMGYGNQLKYAVANSILYEVADAGTVTNRGAVADDLETVVAGNYTDVTVTAGGNYYTFDGTVTQPANKAFTNVGSHCYCGGYTVITEADGKRFQWSTLGDATTLDALDFAAAEQVDDNIVRPVELAGNLILLCETSMEIWTPGEPFSIVTTFNVGLKAHNLLARFDDAMFWVGNDGLAYIGTGGQPRPVSTPAVNTSIAINDPTHCFFYEDRGHKFLVIRFADRPAWAYDLVTGEWHERAEGAGNSAWRAVAAIRGGSGWLVGNTDGGILDLQRTNQDINGQLYRTMVSKTAYRGEDFRVPYFEVNARVGDHMLTDAIDFELDAGQGFGLDGGSSVSMDAGSVAGGARDAFVDLAVSRDGGKTWSPDKQRSAGGNQDYDQTLRWRSLGRSRQFTIRLTCSEPADISFNAIGNMTVA